MTFLSALMDVSLRMAERVPVADIEVVRCEDGETVMLMAPDEGGQWIARCFELSAPTPEGRDAEFDEIRQAIQHGEPAE